MFLSIYFALFRLFIVSMTCCSTDRCAGHDAYILNVSWLVRCAAEVVVVLPLELRFCGTVALDWAPFSCSLYSAGRVDREAVLIVRSSISPVLALGPTPIVLQIRGPEVVALVLVDSIKLSFARSLVLTFRVGGALLDNCSAEMPFARGLEIAVRILPIATCRMRNVENNFPIIFDMIGKNSRIDQTSEIDFFKNNETAFFNLEFTFKFVKTIIIGNNLIAIEKI